jgi:hypothetical protein
VGHGFEGTPALEGKAVCVDEFELEGWEDFETVVDVEKRGRGPVVGRVGMGSGAQLRRSWRGATPTLWALWGSRAVLWARAVDWGVGYHCLK